jgi:hypothetical protein
LNKEYDFCTGSLAPGQAHTRTSYQIYVYPSDVSVLDVEEGMSEHLADICKAEITYRQDLDDDLYADPICATTDDPIYTVYTAYGEPSLDVETCKNYFESFANIISSSSYKDLPVFNVPTNFPNYGYVFSSDCSDAGTVISSGECSRFYYELVFRVYFWFNNV